MAEVRARDEALVAVDLGLTRWAVTARAVFAQATAVADGAQASAEAVVRRCENRVAALAQLLRSLRPDDDRRRAAERDLAVAEESLQRARLAVVQITRVAQRLRVLERGHAQSADALVSAARTDLAKRMTELGSYRSSGSATGGSETTGMASRGNGAAVGPSWLTGTGLAEIDVAAADFSDNLVIGPFGRGGTTRADYRWAVQTWDDVVRPGVADGLARADFEARDAQRGAPPLRRTASVYDMFLGDSDRLRVSRQADGTLDVTNGRHRLAVARELGIRWLPAEVADP